MRGLRVKRAERRVGCARAWARINVTGAVAAVLLTSALAGCSGSASSGAIDQPTDSPTSATTSPSDQATTSQAPPTGEEEGCPYLTAEQVTAALGAPTKETAGTVNACFFDPEGGDGPSVLLSRVDVQIDPADYARQSKLLCEGDVTDVDAGDVAFACVMGLGPQGQLYLGRVLVNVAVNDAPDEATGIALAAALLPEVTIPPASGRVSLAACGAGRHGRAPVRCSLVDLRLRRPRQRERAGQPGVAEEPLEAHRDGVAVCAHARGRGSSEVGTEVVEALGRAPHAPGQRRGPLPRHRVVRTPMPAPCRTRQSSGSRTRAPRRPRRR